MDNFWTVDRLCGMSRHVVTWTSGTRTCIGSVRYSPASPVNSFFYNGFTRASVGGRTCLPNSLSRLRSISSAPCQKVKFSTMSSIALVRLHRVACSCAGCTPPRCLLATAGPLVVAVSTEPARLHDGCSSKQARGGASCDAAPASELPAPLLH